jgi:hypothetical protein
VKSNKYPEDDPEHIVEVAVRALKRSHLRHYEANGIDRTRYCLRALFDVTARCLRSKDTAPVVKYAEDIAHERFSSGFGLCEVQTAFNALEEAIWLHILEHLEPTEFFETMSSVSTVLGAGKDALARTYASLAAQSGATQPSLGAYCDYEDGPRLA